MKRNKSKTSSTADKASASQEDNTSPITLMRELQAGTLSPTTLSLESRRACVEHLVVEGYGVPAISEILQVSPRTTQRDLEVIREANAIERDPSLVSQFVGELVQQGRQSIARMRRVASERDCPHATRVEAERCAWTVMRELAETLQGLGYLPTAAQEIHADLTHRLEQPACLEELQAQLEALKPVLQEIEGAEAADTRLASIEGDLARSRASQKIHELDRVLSVSKSETQSHERNPPDVDVT